MTLTLEINPQLEEALRATAERAGVPFDRFVQSLLQEGVLREPARPDVPPPAEATLLQKVNEGLSEATWARYDVLKSRRDAGTLTPEEHTELLGLVNEVEIWNARRIEMAGQLARLRGVPLRDLVQQLGLVPASNV